MFRSLLRKPSAPSPARSALKRRKRHRERRAAVELLEGRQMLTVSPIDVWVAADYEGDSGSKHFEFWVDLVEPISEPLTVTYRTEDLDEFAAAEAGSDYAATSGTLVFEPGGLTSQVVTVEVFGDTEFEFDERFLVVFTPSDGSGDVAVEGYIAADDEFPVLSIEDVTIAEGSDDGLHEMLFTVTRTGGTGNWIEFGYEILPGTADEGDFIPYVNWVAMAPGQMTVTIEVTYWADTIEEPDEEFYVSVGPAFMVFYGNPIWLDMNLLAVGTLLNDDSGPSMLVPDHFFTEGNDGSSLKFIELYLQSPPDAWLEVYVSSVDGTATAGSDYSPIDEYVLFAPGEMLQTVPFFIFGDRDAELHETFTVEVRSVTGALLTSGTVTIVNDDIENSPPIADAGGPYIVSEAGQVVLDASGSSDPSQPSNTLIYEWDLDYDGVAFQADRVGRLAAIDPFLLGWDGPSQHTVALRVTDEQGAVSNIATTTVDVVNLAPSVDLGANFAVTEGTNVSVLAQYFDVDPLTFRWHLVEATNGHVIPDQTTPELQFLANAGTYTFDFTATDDDGAATTKSLVINVQNIRPSVDLGPSRTVLEGSTVTMTATVNAPATDSLTYNWSQINPNGQIILFPDGPTFGFVPIDDGDYFFFLTVWDDEDTSGSDFTRVTVLNALPAADAGEDQTAVEGSPVTLVGSGTDPGQDVLAYEWRLVDSSNGQQVPPHNDALFTFVPIDDGTYTFELTVTDDDGATAIDIVTVSVVNSAPTAFISGPSAGVPSQPLAFLFGVDDPSVADMAAEFIFEIDWGDGSVQTLASGAPLDSVPHAYANPGTYAIEVVAIDKDGDRSAPINWQVEVTPTLMVDGILYVGGGDGDDTILINPGPTSGSIHASINGVVYGTFVPTVRVVAYGGQGNDTITMHRNLPIDAWLFGGAGDDLLASARGNDVLSGGEGNDQLSSGQGRDLLFGGAGLDLLSGGQDDDVVISGTSRYEADEQALAAIMAEWTSTRDFLTRRNNLRNGSGSADRLNDEYFLEIGSTVFDDDEDDLASGGPGQNWIL